MRKLTIALLVFCYQLSLAQDKTYLLFEFMKVDNEQEASYAETENFWEKIHEQRAQNGDFIGWDLWSLQPGGEDQKYQYMTVHVYNDPVKMMSGGTLEDLMGMAKKAYPDMSEEQIMEKLNHSSKTRDLAQRLYLELIDETDDDFEMPTGMVTRVNFMKAKLGQYQAYEKMEGEIFKPMHQKEVEAGVLSNWGLARVMLPYGSDTYASHITFDMFNDYEHMFGDADYEADPLTEEQQKAIQEGLATRELKWSAVAKLIKKVRAPEALTDSE